MRRGVAALTGALVVAVYATSAALSGHLSPIAGRPLLDGIAPPVPYRWAEPPPELATTNLEPAAGSFRVELGDRGSVTKVFTTDDAQVTLILERGTFDAVAGERAVEVTIEPLGASAVESPEDPLMLFGNVLRIEAAYLPSGEPAEPRTDVRIVLVYPFVANVHSHEVLVSPDGRGWTAVDTNDLPSIQQADGLIGTLGFISIAGVQVATSPPTEVGAGGSRSATIAIVVGLVVLVIGAVVVMRPTGGSGRRGASKPGRGSATGSGRTR